MNTPSSCSNSWILLMCIPFYRGFEFLFLQMWLVKGLSSAQLAGQWDVCIHGSKGLAGALVRVWIQPITAMPGEWFIPCSLTVWAGLSVAVWPSCLRHCFSSSKPAVLSHHNTYLLILWCKAQHKHDLRMCCWGSGNQPFSAVCLPGKLKYPTQKKPPTSQRRSRQGCETIFQLEGKEPPVCILPALCRESAGGFCLRTPLPCPNPGSALPPVPAVTQPVTSAQRAAHMKTTLKVPRRTAFVFDALRFP